ncbi:unnamed protein product [Brachionus calyciflorus]|uniref:WAP domain-containing protein n=1 Tax=Brachionus calyciflorus TaxID=104777 RepID=A0A813S5J2_9BILA|nr:unnamed protein product [Brachionus calyciflorus]
MKFFPILVILGVLISDSLAFFGPRFNLNNLDYPQFAQLPQPQLGPRFNLKKEEELNEIQPEVPQETEAPRRRLQTCPAELIFETCDRECRGNRNCPGNKVCCRHSCGTSCVNPKRESKEEKPKKIVSEETAEPVEEPKVSLECPKVNPNVTCSEIRDLCKEDSDCDLDQKCCRVRCSFRCVGPRVRKFLNERPVERKAQLNQKPLEQKKTKNHRINSMLPNENNMLQTLKANMFYSLPGTSMLNQNPYDYFGYQYQPKAKLLRYQLNNQNSDYY